MFPRLAIRALPALLAAAAGCGASDADRTGDGGLTGPAAPSPAAWFTDIATASGLDFVHTTGREGDFYFPEIAGSGCGLFDYDNDGDLDIYAVQARRLGGDGPAPRNRLYRNDLTADADGVLHPVFVDVTAAMGVGDDGYGMGVAVADYDNDGDLDLYVTNFGPNRLYRNDGPSGFTDVAASVIPPEDRWSTSASFVDYDRDGFVDLFVANYVSFSIRENKRCHSASGRRDYCGPQSFEPVSDRLFHNNGDGTFSDVTSAAGIDRARGSGLGVVSADFNGDAWPDIYVANDGNANQLWMNRGDGTFENTALLAGAAYNADGHAEAGMGVSAADFDLDGDQDIFLSHLVGEHNTLLVNDGAGFFDDRSEALVVAASSWGYTGFGTEWADFDGDGLLDLFVANGGVKIVEAIAFDSDPYGNPNLLLSNLGPPGFTYADVSDPGGPAVTRIETSRGAAFGDVDNDGDVDVLISTSNGPLRLLTNEIGDDGAWLVLRLVGTVSNRSAIGAVVRLQRAGRPDVVRRVHTDGSYCSANDLRLFFGLGHDRGAQTVTVNWPAGLSEVFMGLDPGRVTTLQEGRGEAVP